METNPARLCSTAFHLPMPVRQIWDRSGLRLATWKPWSQSDCLKAYRWYSLSSCCSASTPSAWRLVSSSRASCRSCRCSSAGSLSNTPFVSPVLALLGTFARLRLSACDAPCTASARLDLRFAKGHDSVDPFK